jgi:hypothetical protein
MPTPNNGMSRSESVAIDRLLTQIGRTAKVQAQQRKAELLAHLEAEFAAKFEPDDLELQEVMAELEAEGQALEAKAKAAIAAKCDALGIPPRFRPWVRASVWWHNRGENVAAERRAELRRVGERAAADEELSAILAIEQRILDFRTRLTLGTVQSYEARRFTESLPAVADLMPPLTVKGVERFAQAQGARTPEEVLRFITSADTTTAQLPAGEGSAADDAEKEG